MPRRERAGPGISQISVCLGYRNSKRAAISTGKARAGISLTAVNAAKKPTPANRQPDSLPSSQIRRNR